MYPRTSARPFCEKCAASSRLKSSRGCVCPSGIEPPRSTASSVERRRSQSRRSSRTFSPQSMCLQWIRWIFWHLSGLVYKMASIESCVYRKLRLGKYTVDARLDLHRLNVEQARRSVYQFVADCMEQDIRCALITHGKGVGRAQPALLKSCVAHWLPQFQEVLAFHSAQTAHGGTGATYLLLRKSERKRQENWERQNKRRG